ncbi:MAG TPA: hypothetical protein VHJ34_03100 [Actinomycetota bacterium]|nr:hypothetical protein [Actinomycetota bacterium]
MPRSRRRTGAVVAAALLTCALGGPAAAQAATGSCVYDPTANAFLPAVDATTRARPGAPAIASGVASLASVAVSAVVPTAGAATRPAEGTPWDAAPKLAPEGLAPGLAAFLSGPC